MIEIKGKNGVAIVYADNIEETAYKQILVLMNHPAAKGSKVRIMPDVHAGVGCVIGLSMTYTDKIIPNLVGVDIGCGVVAYKIDANEVDFARLDNTIENYIPTGFSVREDPIAATGYSFLDNIIAPINKERAMRSIGTLGGGNHFIELAKDNSNNIYLLVHTGSRHMGLEIANHYQNLTGDKQLGFLTGELMENYLHDMAIAQKFADINRTAIAKTIVDAMGWNVVDKIHSIHNYVDIENHIIRKGAVAAYKDQKLVIPINMRDGTIVARGRGNEEWNCTAPHGAGRLYGRSAAKKTFTVEEYKKSMTGIYSSTISESTLDECPMAYKDINSILGYVTQTVEVLDIIKPIYNYKG